MFVQSTKFVDSRAGNRQNISIYGQESNPTTRKLCLMNLAIRGIEADIGEYNADTFHSDLHKTLKADYILANPPFNLSAWGADRLAEDQRWKYGTPPNGNANFAWIQHMIYHLSPNGKLGLVLANGSLSSNTGGEGEIRKKIVQDDLVWGIVALPSQLFYGVQIPATLWFISRNKPQKGKTLFVDARKMGEMKTRRLRELSEADILKIADTFTEFDEGRLEDEKGYCAAVSLDEIAKQDFILTPGRYVGIEEQEDDGEPFDEKMTRLTGELGELWKKSHKLEDEIKERLGRLGYEI
jgi:type I restriction enzyme M protein